MIRKWDNWRYPDYWIQKEAKKTKQQFNSIVSSQEASKAAAKRSDALIYSHEATEAASRRSSGTAKMIGHCN